MEDDPADDCDLALAADCWRCRHCGRRFPDYLAYGDGDHSEDECLARMVMDS